MVVNYIMMYRIQQDDLYYGNTRRKKEEKDKREKKEREKTSSLRRKACVCATFLMWGATCFLSFAIGYRYEEDCLCNCSTVGREL